MNLGNMNGATVVFNGGGAVNVPITIPARGNDGHGKNVYLDLRSTVVSTATSWTITITGATAGTIAFGRIFLARYLREIDVMAEGWAGRNTRPSVTAFTVGGKKFVTDKGVKTRGVDLHVKKPAAFVTLTDLFESAKGQNRPWPLVPYEDVNDPLWVTFTDDTLPWTEPEGSYVKDALIPVEQWMGLPL